MISPLTPESGAGQSRPLRVGLIGTGNICLQHAQAIRCAQHPAEIVALFNHNPQKLQAFPQLFAQQAGIPLCTGECQLFTELETMLDQCALDMVYVTTPHPTHVDMALPAVKRGIACMLEKPLDISLQQAKKQQAAAAASGAYIGVIAQSRFFPAVERIAQYLHDHPQDPAVTGIVNVMAWRDEHYYKSNKWRGSWEFEGGGVLVNQSVHELDLLCHFLGKVKSVYGIWRNINHPYIEVDDTAQALVTFESGAVANVLVSNSVNPAYKNYVRVVTQSGHTMSVTTHEGVEPNAGLAAYDFNPYNDVFTPAAAGEADAAAAKAGGAGADTAPAHAHAQAQTPAPAQSQSPFPYFTLQFDNFAEAVLKRQPELVRSNLDTALGCMLIFQGVYLSQKLGRPVTAAEILQLAP